MYTKIRILGAVSLALAVVFSSCNLSPVASTPTKLDPNAVLTAAALTAQARGTELALTTPSPVPATPTETATPTLQPTFPSITATLPVSGTLVPGAGATPTLGATITQGVPPAPASGDRVEFVADVTIPDGTDLDPGADFTKTWRLKNAGTTTWSTAYSLVHVSNDKIEGPATVSLPKNVAPGETLDLSVDLTAPQDTGTHTSYWKLSNDRGQLFGLGANGTGAFYVQIDVGGSNGSSGTPVATSTPGGSDVLLSGLSTSIDNPDFSGSCPHTYNITAVFTLNAPATITYELEAGSDNAGFNFNLPAAQTSAFAAGTQTLVFTLNIDSTVDGWVRLLITDPEDARSRKANFSLTCE